MVLLANFRKQKEAGLSKTGESQNFQESVRPSLTPPHSLSPLPLTDIISQLSRIKAQDDEEVRMNLTRELKTGYEKGNYH